MSSAVYALLNRGLTPRGARFVQDTEIDAATGPVPVSVVIPAFNRERLLPRALASVAAQSLAPAEVIVVDDGSTDATAEIAERHGARVVRLEANRGASAARAHGVLSATHPWVALLDSDDEWLPWMLQTLWPRRDRHDFVTGGFVWMRDGEVLRYDGLPFGAALELRKPDLLVWPRNFVPAAGVLARRDPLLYAMESGSSYRYSEDFAVWLRMLTRGSGLVVARPVMRYHVHGEQKSVSINRYRDQHAIVREILGGTAHGRALLRRRIRVDSWDEARLRPGSDGLAQTVLQLARPGPLSVLGAVVFQKLQARRTRALTADCDLHVGGTAS